MAINRNKMFLVYIFLVMNSSLGFAQTAGSFYYWNGQDKIEMTMVPDHVIEFTSPEHAPQTSKVYKTLSEKKLSGGVRLFKLRSAEFSELFKTKGVSSIKSSPLFKQGSDFKALAGGVLITFKPGTSDATIQQYCDSQGLKLKKKYSMEGQAPLWLVEAPAGIESLNLANSIQENPPDFVEKAKPNFWQAIDTKELKKINFPRKPSK